MADKKKYLDIVVRSKNEASKGFKDVQKEADKMKSSFAGITAKALAVTGGITAMAMGLKKAVVEGANFDSVQQSFNELAGSVNINANQMLVDLQRASGGTVSATDLMLTANKAMTFGIGRNSEELAGMMEFSRRSARKMGISVTQAFDNLTTGIARNSIMILDNLGITGKDMKEAQKAYAEELGKTVEQLTEVEQKQSMVNATIRKAEEDTRKFGEMQLNMNEKIEVSKAMFSDLTAKIGQQFLPIVSVALSTITGYLQQFLDWIRKDAEGANHFGTVMLVLGKQIVAVGKVFKFFSMSVITGIKNIWSVFKGFFNFLSNGFKDATNYIKDWGKYFSDVWKNIKTGNVKGLFTALNKEVNFSFSNISDGLGEMADEMLANSEGLAGSWDELNASLGDVALAMVDGISSTTGEAFKMNTVFQSTAPIVQEAGGKVVETFDKLTEKVADFNSKSADALADVGKKVIDLNNKMLEAVTGKRQKETDLNNTYAQEYVKQEERVAELTKQVAEESDVGKKAILRDQLAREKTALEQRAHWETIFSDQITEIKRRAGLTEFERATEDLEQKRIMIWEEFAEKKSQIEKLLQLEYDKIQRIKAIAEKGLAEADKINAQKEKMTAESINREIAYYNKLAKAIADAKSGKMSSSISVGGGTEARATQIINNVNIKVDSGSSKKVANDIMNGLKNSNLMTAY